jgi:hypothetical protein
MTGYPPHDPGIFVMHLALQDTPTPRAALGTRIGHLSGSRALQVAKSDTLQLEPCEDVLSTKFIQGDATHHLDEFTQQDEP